MRGSAPVPDSAIPPLQSRIVRSIRAGLPVAQMSYFEKYTTGGGRADQPVGVLRVLADVRGEQAEVRPGGSGHEGADAGR